MNRMEKIAGRVAATDKTFAEKRLEEAVSILRGLPVAQNFSGREAVEAKNNVVEAVTLLEGVIDMFPTPVTFNVYGLTHSRAIVPVSFDNEADMVRWLATHGVKQTGVETSAQRRRELQGRPTFDMLAGPMYDGPKKIRYETWDINEIMSR